MFNRKKLEERLPVYEKPIWGREDVRAIESAFVKVKYVYGSGWQNVLVFGKSKDGSVILCSRYSEGDDLMHPPNIPQPGIGFDDVVDYEVLKSFR